MSDDTQVPASGALSVDQAVMAMELPKKEPEAPVEAAPAQETEAAEPTVESGNGAETQPEAETTEEKAEPEAEEANQPAIEPPKFWDAESKKRFGELPRDVQEIIRAKEDEVTKATARSMQDMAEKRKAYEAEAAKYADTVGQLAKVIPEAKNALQVLTDSFNQKWGNVDWNATIDQYGADATLKLQNQMEAERAAVNAQLGRISQLDKAKAEAEQAEFLRFVADESAKLEQLAPELTDEKLGPERKQALGKFLIEQGADPKEIPKIPAWQAAIAYDAMKWRNGQATAKALVNAKPQPAPAKKAPAKPTGTNAPASPQHARIQALSRKSELSIDEAVELANLKGPQPA